jgi:hypothetical protein
MNKPTAVNMTGIQTPYGTKHDNIEIGDASIDYSNNDSGLIWYNSPDTAGKYVIFSAANDNGYMTATPLFWVCNQTDDELVRLVNGLPNRRGEVPFTTAIQATDWLTSEPNYYLSEDAGGGGGAAQWSFYALEGPLGSTPPPILGGQVIFTDNDPIGGGVDSTFNPNQSGGIDYFNFNVNDSFGVDHTAEFLELENNGGTISVTQNGNTATYTGPAGMALVQNMGGSAFLAINANMSTQTVQSGAIFVYGDPVTLTITINND